MTGLLVAGIAEPCPCYSQRDLHWPPEVDGARCEMQMRAVLVDDERRTTWVGLRAMLVPHRGIVSRAYDQNDFGVTTCDDRPWIPCDYHHDNSDQRHKTYTNDLSQIDRHENIRRERMNIRYEMRRSHSRPCTIGLCRQIFPNSMILYYRALLVCCRDKHPTSRVHHYNHEKAVDVRNVFCHSHKGDFVGSWTVVAWSAAVDKDRGAADAAADAAAGEHTQVGDYRLDSEPAAAAHHRRRRLDFAAVHAGALSF